MSTFHEAFKAALSLAWERNIEAVIRDAYQTPVPDYLTTKIANECNRTGMNTPPEVLYDLKNRNKYAARLFCKDPLKQNFAEQFQLTWAHEHNIPDMRALPGGGKSAYYLVNGEIKTGLSSKPSGSNATKSFDFRSDAHDMWCYAKYTNEEGGAQDNQHADGLRFIEQAISYMKKNPESMTKWIFIADGAYYNDVRRAHVRQIIPPDFQDRINIYSSVDLCQTITA